MIKYKNYIGIFCGGLVLASMPVAFAASLTLGVDPTAAHIHQLIRVDVTLDAWDVAVNAVQGVVRIPGTLLAFDRVETGHSPVSFWIDVPRMTGSDTLLFSGIIPNGFQGFATSVLTLWLVPQASGSGAVSLDTVKVLKNDGAGSAIPVPTSSIGIFVDAAIVSSTRSRISFIMPDVFVPVVTHDPNIFDDKYFIVFSTTDKGSGIDHYEIMEGQSSWRTVSSPYVLGDQSLSSDIYIRAVDHDGNFTIVKLPAKHPSSRSFYASGDLDLIILLSILLMLLVIVLRVLLKKRKNRV